MLELEDGRIENISIEEGKKMLEDIKIGDKASMDRTATLTIDKGIGSTLLGDWTDNYRLGPPIDEGTGKENVRLGDVGLFVEEVQE